MPAPNKPAPASGPGKFSRRTDGGPIKQPDIDHPDLQYGDRQKLTEAQRIAKTAGSQGASSRRMTGEAPTRGKLPPWLTQTADTDPSSPSTAGLGMGPGPGPEALDASEPAEDVREVVLQFLAETYGNKDAVDMLNKYRMERSAPQPMSSPALPSLPPALPSEAPATTSEPLDPGFDSEALPPLASSEAEIEPSGASSPPQ